MKKLFVLYFFVCASIAFSQQSDNNWTTYFEQSGFKGTPDYNQTMQYFQRLADNSEYAELKTFGMSPQGRELKFLVVNSKKNFDLDKIKKSGEPVVLIICGIHSGEIEGKDASMILLREILITKEKKTLVDSLTLLVVPIFSVDAHERRSKYNRINQNGPEEMGWRTTSQNLNLNRDWMKADAPEMQAMLQLVSKWNPDFVIDSHTTDGADYQYTLTYSVEKYRNIFSKSAEWIKNKFIPYFETGVEEAGFLVYPYIYLKNWRGGLDDGLIDWASTPRFSTGYFALRNRPCLLIETHMLKPYKDRVYSTKAAFETVLNFVNENAEELVNLNEEADKESINEFCKKKNFLPISFNISDKYSEVDFKGYEFYWENSDISGGKKLVYTHKPADFKVIFYNDVIAADSVKLPAAYIIPQEWKEIVVRIHLHGIDFSTIKKDTMLNVTVYKFKNVKLDSNSYEGRQRASFDYDEEKKVIKISEGDIFIPTAQSNIRIIAGLLEPRSGDSFVQWGFFNSIFEQKEYFESYVMENLAEEMLKEDPQLKNEFEQKLKENESFRNDPNARLNFFYKRSPYWDNKLNVYPVLRVE